MPEPCKHDLAPGACTDCRPRQARSVLKLAGYIHARYHGGCAGCRVHIEPDDLIAPDGEGGWLCQECGP